MDKNNICPACGADNACGMACFCSRCLKQIMDLNKLGSLSDEEFERQRAIMINDFIESLPEKHRKVLALQQAEIDRKRKVLSREEFISYLSFQMSECIANLEDTLQSIKNQLS